MQTFNNFDELVAGQAGCQSEMSTFNSQVSDYLTSKVQPLIDKTARDGEVFRLQKDTFLGEFEKRGVTAQRFKGMYRVLRELQQKKRTLKSVSEIYPDIPKKEIQQLSGILLQSERTMLDALRAYQNQSYEAVQEINKQYDIFNRNLPEPDTDLDKAYDDLHGRIVAIDDDVRSGLKI